MIFGGGSTAPLLLLGHSMKTNDDIYAALKAIEHAIYPAAVPVKDASGGQVESLTEAVMGVTAALCTLAAEVREIREALGNSL